VNGSVASSSAGRAIRGEGFALRRPWLILRDLIVDRNEPDLARLASIESPEGFVWAILPHAARTFSACIALLPAEAAGAAAVAYLYCRMLDTYEDLLPDAEEREAALLACAGRLPRDAEATAVPPAPRIERSSAADARDESHLLLVRRCALVDRAYLKLDPRVRPVIADLVRDMAEGMCRFSRLFREQGGVLRDEEQVAGYCEAVMGNPVVFTIRLLTLFKTGDATLDPAGRDDARAVGEMVQLANVTRDVEKDLRRGIAYHPLLADDLGKEPDGDPEISERVRIARKDLVRMAMGRAPSYRGLLDTMDRHAGGFARASAVLMLLFTDRHYRKYGTRAGLTVAGGARRTTPGLLLHTFPALFSRRWSHRICRQVESDFARTLALCEEG